MSEEKQMKFKCQKCKHFFIEKIKEGEKVVKYPHGFMINCPDGRMDVIYCGKCKSEKIDKLAGEKLVK